MNGQDSAFAIREAVEDDFDFVVRLMVEALDPYYGGDHVEHAKRIFSTHVSGGKDRLGFFSREQRMFIATLGNAPVGMVHVVGKRQQTYKISPLIVNPAFQGKHGIGSRLLKHAEDYARTNGARQMYCTVAEQNASAAGFFRKNGYTVAGRSDSHYKLGMTELMLYKLFVDPGFQYRFDRPHISVLPAEPRHEGQIRRLLLDQLPTCFSGIDASWVDALFSGYRRSGSRDINEKYKVIYVATDRANEVLGVVGATPKKGEPIKLMPFIATDLPAFTALLSDVPFFLKPHGRKLYVHITPTVDETIALQQQGWRLDAAMPAAYHPDTVTQQWSFDIGGENVMRMMRVKQRFLDFIKNGQKSLEVRVGYDSVKTIRPGERVSFASRDQTQVVRIAAVRNYPDFSAMLRNESAERIVPGMDLDDLLRLLREIYPPDRERLGVVVLELEPERPAKPVEMAGGQMANR